MNAAKKNILRNRVERVTNTKNQTKKQQINYWFFWWQCQPKKKECEAL